MTKISVSKKIGIVVLPMLFTLLATPLFAQSVGAGEITGETQMSEQIAKQIAEQIAVTKERLQLTEEQAPAVEEILKNTYAERLLILDKYGMNLNDPNFERPDRRTMMRLRKDMDQLDEDSRKQLSKHLTKDQMKTLKSMEKERQQRMRERFRNAG